MRNTVLIETNTEQYEMKTTAQLRNEAGEAERALNWKLAADLYTEALRVYPSHHSGSQLAIADKKHLAMAAHSCRRMQVAA